MISLLTSILTRFITYGFSGFTRKDKPIASAKTPEELESTFKEILTSFDERLINYSEPNRVIAPFQSYLKINGSSISTKTEFTEALLLSLNNIGEEIASVVPGSTVEISIEPTESKNNDTLVGRLTWNIDTVTALVYPICMDLLKDGFTYRADTRSFVITTRMKT